MSWQPSWPVAQGRLGAWALALSLLAAPARAADPDPAPFAVNGFGTIGVARSSEGKADFVFDNLQPIGIGYSRNWSTDVDSRLGVQLSADLDSRWSVLLQVVSEYRWNGSYEPYVNWASVKYEFTPDVSVRVGRIALPSFMASNSRRVGYSNVSVRPPPELYRLMPVTNSDGVDASWRARSGEVSNILTALYGKKTVTNTRAIDVHSSGIAGIYDTLDYGPASLHLALQRRDVDNQVPPRGKFMSLGASYDPGAWLLAAEWVRVSNYNGAGLEVVRAAWDVQAAYRVRQFTPFLTLAELRPLSETGVAPAAQKTISAGVRWDCMKMIDLKLQFDRLHLAEHSVGTLQNLQPGFVPGGKVNVLSLTADFVF